MCRIIISFINHKNTQNTHYQPFSPIIFGVCCLLLHNVHINEECVEPKLEQLLLRMGGQVVITVYYKGTGCNYSILTTQLDKM